MLHSTLPRAFLPPGLNYLGGYYGDDGHVYSTATHYVPCLEDPYARIADQRIQLSGWETGARPVSPSPLDLSLKPPPASQTSVTEECEAIEVDDEENLRFAMSLQRRSLMAKRSYSNSEELSSGMDDFQNETGRSSSVQSYHSYADMISAKDSADPRVRLPTGRREDLTSPRIHGYPSFEELRTKKEVTDPGEAGYAIHNPTDPSVCSAGDQRDYQTLGDQTGRKLHLASPTHPGTQSYHQQLLLTPQHHLQTIHAPMTPPSTPSPPQCPRRRTREDPEVTPPHASTTTPKSTGNHTEKNRPKKKHARRLKFDEDTSSPVSGTVILGPDEAVVTGDIDPAFNIVEVTEEARAELAKIENRLGPYQCKLCRQLHDDAFQLAQHRCSRIAHVEYRCPECDKRFSCPANLASHRRWHKPRMPNGDTGPTGGPAVTSNSSNSSTNIREPEIPCTRCDAKFTRAAALRKHLATQHPEANNNISMTNNNSTNNSNDTNAAFDDFNASMPGKPLCPPMNLADVSLTNELP
ncbi:uncharacterized protein [Venturia canescens]|uniref:uncharacterized protein n=1 Tax=Venturia canescens TaxID=32260 RepID=UPI001C9C68D3|nr:uncharacterized protein LOC122417354 [Venturia canescens]